MDDKVKPAGRPISNWRVREIMADRGCSRMWAYVLYRRERKTGQRVPPLKK